VEQEEWMEIGRKARQWKSLLAEWQDSGLSQREFCRRRDLSFSRFHYWRHKMNQDIGESAEMVRVSDAGEVVGKRGGSIRIHVGERFIVEGCEEAEPQSLERVLRVVAGL
jgi:hypothetical protein